MTYHAPTFAQRLFILVVLAAANQSITPLVNEGFSQIQIPGFASGPGQFY